MVREVFVVKSMSRIRRGHLACGVPIKKIARLGVDGRDWLSHTCRKEILRTARFRVSPALGLVNHGGG